MTDEPHDDAREIDRDVCSAARVRDTTAQQRDADGQIRDTAGALRDTAAGRRDRQADARTADSGAPASHDRLSAEAAASDRASSRSDRSAAADDRAAAASDRTRASANRSASARDRRDASLDKLTGVLNREAGLLELEREVTRSRRDGDPLVLAFVDVDQLKHLNDTDGHAAGDQLLAAVTHTLTTVLQPLDLVFRYGGDEFLCVARNADLTDAGPRFAGINALLDASPGQGSVTIGLAQLRPDDTSVSLIARADAQLYEQRRS